MADTVYRALRTERRDQAVMISGESGAGKTEATKRLLQFYAETCPAPERGGAVRDRLLQSNPVLEVRGQPSGGQAEAWRRSCNPQTLILLSNRPLEMPRPSGTITPADLASTWTCSLTLRYVEGHCTVSLGWGEAPHGQVLDSSTYFTEYLLCARDSSRAWESSREINSKSPSAGETVV